jgi:hypothetical protein
MVALIIMTAAMAIMAGPHFRRDETFLGAIGLAAIIVCGSKSG